MQTSESAELFFAGTSELAVVTSFERQFFAFPYSSPGLGDDHDIQCETKLPCRSLSNSNFHDILDGINEL